MNNIGILRTVRSEFGKAIRKQYEAGEIKISRHKFLQHEIREDGIVNTLDSVQKDNLLAVEVKEELKPVGTLYCNASKNPRFKRGIYDTENGTRCLKSEQHDTSVALEIPVKEATKQGYSLCRGGATASTSRCREAKQEEEESG